MCERDSLFVPIYRADPVDIGALYRSELFWCLSAQLNEQDNCTNYIKNKYGCFK